MHKCAASGLNLLHRVHALCFLSSKLDGLCTGDHTHAATKHHASYLPGQLPYCTGDSPAEALMSPAVWYRCSATTHAGGRTFTRQDIDPLPLQLRELWISHLEAILSEQAGLAAVAHTSMLPWVTMSAVALDSCSAARAAIAAAEVSVAHSTSSSSSCNERGCPMMAVSCRLCDAPA